MDIIVDTSIIIAVIVNEPDKAAIIQATQGVDLLAPVSVHWEIANAFSAMFKRGRITLEEAMNAVAIYRQIPIRYVDVELEETLQIAHQLQIYAYDACLLRCAQKYSAPLLSLDEALLNLAERLQLNVVKVT